MDGHGHDTGTRPVTITVSHVGIDQGVKPRALPSADAAGGEEYSHECIHTPSRSTRALGQSRSQFRTSESTTMCFATV